MPRTPVRFRRLAWFRGAGCGVLAFAAGCGLLSCGSDVAGVRAGPQAVLSSGAAAFSGTVVGSSAAASTLTLTNTGEATLSLTGTTLSDPEDFSVASHCGSELGSGQSCTLDLTFHPQAVAAATATLTLTDNSGGEPGAQQTVMLSGTGLPVPEPQATLSVAGVAFGAAVLHTVSAVQMVTLLNAGTAPLTIGSEVLSDPADFALTTSCGATLSPGKSCALLVSFQPQALGPITGSLTVSDDSGGSRARQVIALSGTGLPVPLAQVVIAPASLSFAPTIAGQSTAAQAVMVSNQGTAALMIRGVAVGDGTDYDVVNGCGSSVAVGASCALSVSFHPQSTGALVSTLTLTDNSGVSSGTVQQGMMLSGTGLPVPVPQGVVSPSAGVFATTQVGFASAPQSFTLSNGGEGPLAVAGIALSDPVNFGLTSQCGPSLPAGASCTWSLVFQPAKTGLLSAAVTVTDNAGGVPGAQQVILLSGTGSALPPAPKATLAPGMLTFPDTMVTTTSPVQVVALLNAGSAPLTLSSVGLSDPQDFSLSSSCPGTLAAGASCTLAVTFQPQTVASVTAALTLTDNSGAVDGSVVQTVGLVGRGIAFAGPRASVSPAELNFPQTITNASAAALTATLTNTGTTALTVANVALSGVGASAFAVTGGTCGGGALAAGASCAETVVYQPTLASAADTASLVFTDDHDGITGSVQTVALAGSALAEVDSVTNFGDSLTCGYFALPHDGTGLVFSQEGYAGLFDTFLGVPAANFCRVGDTAADLSRQWVPFHSAPTSNGNQLYTLMVGVNDAYRYGIPESALNTYAEEVGAALTWLGMPDTDKVLANAITEQTGTWQPDVGFGMISSDPGASLSFPVNQAVAGRSLYVVYHVWALPYGQAGKASILVDGTVQATVDESQGSLVNEPTENGTSDTYLVQTVPLGAAGPHRVSFQSVGPSGSAAGLLWAGVPQRDYHLVDGAPRVLVGLITNSPSGNQTYTADIYNLQLRTLIPALAADGMNVNLVLTDRVMDTGTDFADILHPNNSGHAKLAAAFEKAR